MNDTFLSERVVFLRHICLQSMLFGLGPALLPPYLRPLGRTKIWPNISKDLLETA